MKFPIFSIIITLFLVSCGASKPVAKKSTKSYPSRTYTKSENLRKLSSDYSGSVDRGVKKLIKDAEKFLGTPYKLGGNTASGLDCSGLVCQVFERNDYKMPRRSSEQAEIGDKINIKEVKPGDLLFFATAGGSRVSHVGIVHTIENSGEIRFIHASTSKGVIISSLNEKYWNKAYLHAQRVL